MWILLIALTSVAAEEFQQCVVWNPQQLGPRPASHVSDPDHLLSSRVLSRLESTLHRLNFLSVLNIKGCQVEMVWVVIPTMLMEPHLFCQTLHEQWQVGTRQHRCDHGVTIVFALQDQHVSLCSGKGLERWLSEAKKQRIMDRVRPLLLKERYNEAMEQMVNEMAGVWRVQLSPFHFIQEEVTKRVKMSDITVPAALAPYFVSSYKAQFEAIERERKQQKEEYDKQWDWLWYDY